MNWLAWRQHRKQFMVAGIFLVLFAAFMIPTGLSFWHTYQHALATCGKTDTCNQLNNELFQSPTDHLLFQLVPLAILLVPIVLGLFWGVPFLTKEYAEGTNKLVWTQSVSRKKWLTIKLVWILAGAVITAGVFAALDTWWFRTYNAVNLSRFQSLYFNSQGIVLIAYAVFAVVLGIMFGAWFKRTMVALGVTLFVLIAIVLVIVPNFVRPHYETPKTYKTSLLSTIGPPSSTNSLAPASSGASLVVDSTIVNNKNRPLDWANPPSKCIVTSLPGGNPIPNGHTTAVRAVPADNKGVPEEITSRNGGPAVSFDCLTDLGYKIDVQYQPANRYWTFQWMETALYLGLAIIPVAGTYWFVLKRDA